ncbi:DUF2878 domain-containing protein [Marinobacter sp.]|uniref:DUF2878 domain-containing protein n=1 Tax=Marinobacter sp. TaxID=50741 RepID=UPI00384F9678
MIQSSGLRNLTNFLIFQAGWLACVIWPGMETAALALAIVAVHLLLISQKPAREWQFILLGTVLGSLLDGIWFQTGVMKDASGTLVWTPVWLIGVWAVFLTTLSHSLSWMGKRAWLPFVLAPIAGPFAYWSASQLGAVVLPELVPSLLALALGWLVIFPLLMHIKHRFFPEITP